ncbi:hypothetical protein CQA53_09060 [Helicobacter didelphidarum]|uniref:Uncharacterized protein n=1 Tax=Helicobacter didelphidarum TaxID=2040648 RepID=A0A3D8ICL2_9HELI|nr:hypothetical protein [Helicobacter didelphidarum]RDU62686.1 hypothetical protein CQA53_09060 [Helicobacter didelphidarum]
MSINVIFYFIGIITLSFYTLYAQEKHINSQLQIDYHAMIEKREKFFLESLAQKYDSTKIRITAEKLPYIDFCSYPPDRSLPYGALENGRFKGEKITDLPFACNQNSGAKKFFIKDSNISQAYYIMRFSLRWLSALDENLPPTNTSHFFSINHNNPKKRGEIHYIWQYYDNIQHTYQTFLHQITQNPQRLWIIYNAQLQKYTIIFDTKGKDTEVIVQYLHMEKI